MQYDWLVRETWQLTWRIRSLWILGFFAGGAGPACLGGPPSPPPEMFGGPSPPVPPPGAEFEVPEFEMVADELARWVSANVGLIVALAIFLALLVLASFVLSLIAQGGMARAGAEGVAGRTATLGTAWSDGLRLFWRYLALFLVVLAGLIVVGAAAALAGVLLAALADGATPWFALVTLLMGVSALAIGLALVVGFGIVVPFAQRAIALEDLGPLAGLRAGWSLLRAKLGASLLVWLLSIALSLGAGIVLAFAAVMVLVVAGLVGFVIWAAAGWTAVTISYVVLVALGTLAALLVATAVVNTFFWHYWTLAYLRLAHPPTPDA